jgi:hypothetical protein
VKLPAAGKWVRAAFDHNLDGLSGAKPWRKAPKPAPPGDVAAAPAATLAADAAAQAVADSRLPEFFNYGLTEAAWVVYARRQREVIETRTRTHGFVV